MPPKDVNRMASSVDPDQTALKSSLIRIYTVCSDIYVPIFRIFTVQVIKRLQYTSYPGPVIFKRSLA